jgi:predicted metal-dependent enzyme (double-stranded beta helix superfamily)
MSLLVARPEAAPTELDRWFLQDELGQDGPLDLDALRSIAARVGGRPRLWRHAVRHDENERRATLLHRSRNLDVWLICWLDFQETGLHDHDRSAGAVHVCKGALIEDVLSLETSGALRARPHERSAGTTFGFGGSHIHGVRHAGTRPATSIHVYSPALLSMGHYEVTADGGLERIVRSYEQGIAG